MTPFHVPYVFIPVSPSPERASVSHADIVDADSMHPARLDSWHGEPSGRIVCRLYLETPVAMGLVETRKSDKDRNRAAKVVPGKRWFDTAEDYFLPGNTLRGMVAHIASDGNGHHRQSGGAAVTGLPVPSTRQQRTGV